MIFLNPQENEQSLVGGILQRKLKPMTSVFLK